MPEDQHPIQNLRDHDVLIRLDQKVDLLSSDIKDLKENLAARVTVIENNKADKTTTDQLAKDLKRIQEETIPGIKYRMAYWSGAIALAVILVEVYSHLKH